MNWYAWYDEEVQVPDQAGTQPGREWQVWRELWDYILSGLAWMG